MRPNWPSYISSCTPSHICKSVVSAFVTARWDIFQKPRLEIAFRHLKCETTGTFDIIWANKTRYFKVVVNNYGFKEGNTEKWYDKWNIFLQETTAVFTVKPEVNSELFQITNVVKWCQVGIFTKKNSDFNPKQYFPKPYRGFSFLNQTTLRPEEGRHMCHCKDQVVCGIHWQLSCSVVIYGSCLRLCWTEWYLLINLSRPFKHSTAALEAKGL